jgi:hypothetical protein
MGIADWWRRVTGRIGGADASTAAVASTSTGGPIQATNPAGMQAGAGAVEDEVAEETETPGDD